MIVYVFIVSWNLIVIGFAQQWLGCGILTSAALCLGTSAWMFDMPYLIEFHVRGILSQMKFQKQGRMPFTEWHEIHQVVTPMDVDIFGHMNNARYNRRAEYSRITYFIESGLRKATIDLGVRGHLKSLAMRYRRQILPFEFFRIRTKLIGWKGKELYFEQRFVTTDSKGKEFVNAFSVSIYKIPRKIQSNAVDLVRMVDEEFAKKGDEYLPSSEVTKDTKSNDALANGSGDGINVRDVVLAYNTFESISSSFLNPAKLR
eukprot:CAMPEP_0114496466 /NCGR_PEP_ID=MMETSP0109-20121206/5784_1 /TAXON_ID=29199 /ORGANISM="Chlorarachnion reptans, Strain CCCM449" /LENGTH=258 /DNA_ID=CAMNT_0001673739 /DNA_START=36 /DNA_END=812 /DNA_ORIENTATION=+